MLGEQTRWGDIEHLLATAIDVAQTGNYYAQIAASGYKLDGKPTPPVPLPRPGADGPTKKSRTGKVDNEQVQSMLDRWRKGDLAMVETESRVI